VPRHHHGNRQPATGNRQPATGNRQPATGNRQPATGNRQRATGNGQPATGNRQPATGNRQPATATGNHDPGTALARLTAVKSYFAILKQTVTEFGQDKVPRLGAALAYYTIFSLAPLLLIVIAIAGMAFGKSEAQHQIVQQLHSVMGPTAAKAIEEMLSNAAKPKSGAIATIIGIVTLIMGASGVFGQLKDALNTIWDVEPKKDRGILGMIKDRFLSMGMVFGIGFLLLVALVIDTVITAVLPAGWQVLQLIVSFIVVTVLFAAMFRILPDLKIEWRDVWLGAGFTSLLFVVGKFALGAYLGRSAVGSAYGAAGSLVVLLLWVYYSAQILLFGAEFTQVYARERGSLKEAAERGAGSQPAEKRPAESRPHVDSHPAVVYRTVPAASGGGGAAKMAVGGVAGLFLGALVGGVTAAVVVVKSVKKFFS
jgi:membrane protein